MYKMCNFLRFSEPFETMPNTPESANYKFAIIYIYTIVCAGNSLMYTLTCHAGYLSRFNSRMGHQITMRDTIPYCNRDRNAEGGTLV